MVIDSLCLCAELLDIKSSSTRKIDQRDAKYLVLKIGNRTFNPSDSLKWFQSSNYQITPAPPHDKENEQKTVCKVAACSDVGAPCNLEFRDMLHSFCKIFPPLVKNWITFSLCNDDNFWNANFRLLIASDFQNITSFILKSKKLLSEYDANFYELLPF